MTKPSPEFRAERARHASLTRWAHTPPSERRRKSRAAFRTRFENQVDPDRALPAQERAVMVDAAIAAYVSRMNLARLRKQKATP